MKKNILLLVLFLQALISFGQNGGYAKGDKLLNAGVGVNSYYSGGIPLGVSFEVGISDNISVGANADYLTYKYRYGAGASIKFTTIYVGARGSYHVNDLLKITNEKIDLYVGATVGYRSFKWKDNYSGDDLGGSYGSGVFVGGYIGGKYYFGSNIAVFTELGAIGATNARVGIGFKF